MTDALDPPNATLDEHEPLLDDPRMPRPGQRVAGRYEVLEILGVGGYAVVYRARDERLDDEVALKVLDPYKSSRPQFAARFQQEVRVVRQLKHHNTIKVQDVGVTDDKCLFMAMEYVEGQTLRDLIDETGGLEPGRVVRIVAQILRSLDEAHSLGVIHRDLKPGNVMITQLRGEPDYVKVLDFGIAKALSPELSRVKTQTSEMMCTPAYAAPELLEGGGIGPETDLYALGLAMIEMLTGRDVFGDVGIWGIVHQQISKDPIPIPAEVAALPIGPIIERAVRKPMAERYLDARSMLDDLIGSGLYPTDLLTLTGPRQSGQPTPLPGGRGGERQGGAQPGSRRVTVGLIVLSLLVIAASAAIIAVRYLDDQVSGLGAEVGSGAIGTGSGALATAGIDGGGPLEGDTGGSPLSSPRVEACEAGDAHACLLAAAELGGRADADAYGDARAELLGRACESGLPAACLALGTLTEGRAETTEDYAAALDLYRGACDTGEAEACLRAGSMTASGLGGARNDVQAVALYRRACTFELMDGCVQLAYMYFSGQGITQSYELAHAFSQQACEGGNMQGCGLLGFLYHAGYGFGQNFDLARQHYETACDGGDMTGCTGLAALYEQGLGVAVDLDRALEYYERSCQGEAGRACNRLGEIYRDGLGVAADAERSRGYFARACQAGHLAACAGP